MKKVSSLILGGLFLLFQASTSWAANQTTFTVSATVPGATGISITVSSVNSTSNVFTTLAPGTTALTFDPMTFNAPLGIYLPNHYYALDFGTSGGGGTPDVTVTYSEGANPNGSSNGLGTKSTATFAKEVTGSGGSTTETFLNDQGPKQLLVNLNAQHVPFTDVVGGFLRIYLGVWTGSQVAPADPAAGKPFSNGDAPGVYSGSLVATAVVD